MGDFFDYRLFQIGETPVTVASLVASLVILVVSYLLARLVRRLVSHRLLARTQVSQGLRLVLGRFAGYLIFFLGIAIALQTLGIRATTLTAFGAAVGVGVGLGLQDVVKNFVAGLILLIERPFRVGDRIEIDGKHAEVIEIRPRATVLRTNDDVHLIVPNAKLTEATLVNRSFDRPLFRCAVPVGVGSGSDPRGVEAALLEAASRCEGVVAEPPPSVRFRRFGESSLDFELLCWTERLHRPGALLSELHFLVHETLTRHGIEMPNPQRDIHIRTAPGWKGMEPATPGRGGGRNMNRDEREGKTENVKGRVKEATGALLDDEELQKEGAEQRERGELQEDYGKLRRKAGEALEELGEKIKR